MRGPSKEYRDIQAALKEMKNNNIIPQNFKLNQKKNILFGNFNKKTSQIAKTQRQERNVEISNIRDNAIVKKDQIRRNFKSIIIPDLKTTVSINKVKKQMKEDVKKFTKDVNVKNIKSKIESKLNKTINKHINSAKYNKIFPELFRSYLINEEEKALKLGEIHHITYSFLNFPDEVKGIPLTESMDVKLTSSVSELIDFEEDKITHEGGVRTNVIMKFRGVNIEHNRKVYVYITIAVSNTMTTSEIISLFKKKINQHYDTVNYVVYLDTIDVYINKLSSSGGCEDREHISRVEKNIHTFI